jgi:hypothetical protein
MSISAKTFASPVARGVFAPDLAFFEDDEDLVIIIALHVNHSGSEPFSQTARSFNIHDDHLTQLTRQYPFLFTRQGDLLVSPFSPGKGLVCYNYFFGSCPGIETCGRFHVCAKWLFDTCRGHCGREHRLFGDGGKAFFASFAKWSARKLKKLLLSFETTIPDVCSAHNSVYPCARRNKCDLLHVCAKFSKNRCFEDGCKFVHDVYKCDNRAQMPWGTSRLSDQDAQQLNSRVRAGLFQRPPSCKFDRNFEKKLDLLFNEVPAGPTEVVCTTSIAWDELRWGDYHHGLVS